MDTIYGWSVLGIPISVVIISQFVKIALESRKNGFKWSHLNAYGGMPSTHTAGFVSLTLMVGIAAGITSPVFAVTVAVAVAFIRDAVGIRMTLGQHAKAINRLLPTLNEKQRATLPAHFEEQMGHTIPEMLAGAALGIVLTLCLLLILQ